LPARASPVVEAEAPMTEKNFPAVDPELWFLVHGMDEVDVAKLVNDAGADFSLAQVPAEVAERMSRYVDWRVRMAAAALPNTTAPVLQALAATEKSKEVLEKVGAHPNTPPKTLAALAGLALGGTQVAVAENPNTPEESLVRLLDSNYPAARDAARLALRKREVL